MLFMNFIEIFGKVECFFFFFYEVGIDRFEVFRSEDKEIEFLIDRLF